MVHGDVRDDAHDRLDHIGRVQPPAQADFEDGQVYLAVGEMAEGDHRQKLKEAWIAGQTAVFDQTPGHWVHPCQDSRKVFI